MATRTEKIRMVTFYTLSDNYRADCFYSIVTENDQHKVKTHRSIDPDAFDELTHFINEGESEMIWEEYEVSPAKPKGFMSEATPAKMGWRMKEIRLRKDFQIPCN